MIAMVSEVAVQSGYIAFLDALRARGFEGEIAPDYANRTVLATDNSIYQRLPQAAVFPKHAEDLERLAKLAAELPHRDVVLTPRGRHRYQRPVADRRYRGGRFPPYEPDP
ncbi:hypothetical protein HHSLTHF2_34080 [Vreelandella venusta]|uniref:FAD linked oxidase N-terminal domain-containing protein n=1 Tax=Halomonas hydrothermalis TaxID=115561 RepID=A0A6F8U7I8_9GAMM|nr:hypothetical protein HHSLTHF2_34080 [Halomonas hydrothermalis]